MSVVLGRSATLHTPSFTPTTRAGGGGGGEGGKGVTSDKRFVLAVFAVNETKDIAFPFLNPHLNNTIAINIIGFRLINPKAKEDFEGEQWGEGFAWSWPKGIVGGLTRKPLVKVKKSGGVFGQGAFSLPKIKCNPTTKSGDVLKIAVTHENGTAFVDGIEITLQVVEEWEGESSGGGGGGGGGAGEGPPLVGGPHDAGLVDPQLKILGSNGGTVKMKPVFEEAGGGGAA